MADLPNGTKEERVCQDVPQLPPPPVEKTPVEKTPVNPIANKTPAKIPCMSSNA